MKMKLRLIGLALITCSTAGFAQMREFRFVGTVDQSSPMAPAGATVTGTFAYNPMTQPDMRLGEAAGRAYGYANYALASALVAKVNGHTLTSAGTLVEITNNFGGNTEDSVSVFSPTPMVLDGTPFAEGSFGFFLASGVSHTEALNSTALPRHYNIRQFDGMNYGWVQAHGRSDGNLLTFVINQVTPVHHKDARVD